VRGLLPTGFCARSGETVCQTGKRLGDARTCSRSSSIVPSLVGHGLRVPPGEPKMSSFCLSVGWSVCHSLELQSLRE